MVHEHIDDPDLLACALLAGHALVPLLTDSLEVGCERGR